MFFFCGILVLVQILLCEDWSHPHFPPRARIPLTALQRATRFVYAQRACVYVCMCACVYVCVFVFVFVRVCCVCVCARSCVRIGHVNTHDVIE